MIQPSPYTGFPQGNVQFMTGMNYSGQTFTPVYMAGMQAPVQPFQYQLTAGANAQQIIGQQSHQANNSAKVPEA